ncbi:hypothetical protein NP493_47g04012 [Ridgeia piscesae]|uniref:Cytochrome b5 heme-binding domain-containing protein n=1 Tax=Ridgeia piscesae TaxID=27915 RepID=A0AAD9PBM0_RIDPI|nr:hypothetical protein NP493_47g04012 [Ridgeia piscesae]
MTDGKTREITLAEVKEHTTAEDCWVAVDGKVYDLSDYIDIHPGGNESIEAEAEATKAYDFVGHSAYANKMMDQYQIGILVEVKKEEPPSPEEPETFV